MSTISVRVTLLILAIVLFAVVWSNDHKPQATTPRTVVAYDFDSICSEDVIDPVSHEVVQPQTELVAEAGFLIDTAVTTIDIPQPTPLAADKPLAIKVSELVFPLPRNLTAGEYRIIDRFGNVQTLSVTPEKLLSWGVSTENPARNAYEVCVGEGRWHFIRIEQPVAPAPTQADIAKAWKTVFRFAGQTVSPSMEKVSAPLERWLGGKLNLSGETRELR